jgi:hypothetical protein
VKNYSKSVNLQVTNPLILGEVIGNLGRLANENNGLKIRNDRLTEKNITLTSTVETLNEDLKFKDAKIQSLDDDIANLLEEYVQLQSKLEAAAVEEARKEQPQNNNYKKNIVNFDYLLDLRHLKEEKNELIKENTTLKKKLESVHAELSYKYIPKLEAEKKIIHLEQEKNQTTKKLSLTEIMLEKSRKEIQELRADTVELKKELQVSDKRLSDLYGSNNNLAGEFTLDNFLEDELVVKPSPRKTLTSIKKSDLAEIAEIVNQSTNDSGKKFEDRAITIVETLEDNRSSSDCDNATTHRLSRFMSKIDIENNPDNDFDIRLTNMDIVKSMNFNNFNTVVEKNLQDKEKKVKVQHDNGGSICSKMMSHNYISTKSIYYGGQEQVNYREFFNLTYQSLKLSYDDVEPFLYVFIKVNFS